MEVFTLVLLAIVAIVVLCIVLIIMALYLKKRKDRNTHANVKKNKVMVLGYIRKTYVRCCQAPPSKLAHLAARKSAPSIGGVKKAQRYRYIVARE